MNVFDFDTPLNRKQEHALKWLYYADDVLPLWIADSDYAIAPSIQKTLLKHAQTSTFGYQLAEHVPELNAAVIRWLQKQHNWHVETDWIVWVPGIMVGVNSCCRALTDTTDSIYAQIPNYPPLLKVAVNTQRHSVNYQTLGQGGEWQLDLEDLEEQFQKHGRGMMILTNPMNPCGSVLTKSDLEAIADLCQRYDILMCSDEVHCDLILDDVRHHPAGSIAGLEQRSVTLMSASKTFNLAGLATSFAIIPNPELRSRFYQETVSQQYWVNSFGIQSTIAAFTESDDWYEAQKTHLLSNRDYLDKQLNQIHGLSYSPSNATYLAWIDASGLEVDNPHQYLMDRKVGVSPGADFGWNEYLRLNFACPRIYLKQAIASLQT